MAIFLKTAINLISLVIYIFDLVTDIALAISYSAEHTNWFALTLTFIILPAIVTNILSNIEYGERQNENNTDNNRTEDDDGDESDWVSCLRPTAHCFCLGMVYRYVEVIWYGVRNRQMSAKIKEKLEEKMISVGQLTLLESLLESAPQLVLQLYIKFREPLVIRPQYQNTSGVIQHQNNVSETGVNVDILAKLSDQTEMIQALSITISILSLAWCLTRNTKDLRRANEMDKMKWFTGANYFLWRLTTIAARVLALAMFAAAFTYWFFVVISCHCLVIGIVLCFSTKDNIFKSLLRGIFSIFAFVGVIKEPKLRHCLFYVVFETIEDSILIGLWCMVVDPEATEFYYAVVIFHFSCVAIGFFLMIVYYHCFYPNKRKSESQSNPV